jgi:hypothetical protein
MAWYISTIAAANGLHLDGDVDVEVCSSCTHMQSIPVDMSAFIDRRQMRVVSSKNSAALAFVQTSVTVQLVSSSAE